MSTYRNILVVVDLSADSHPIIDRAQALAAPATLTLMHVVEYVPLEPMGETLLPAMQIEGELVKRATEKLAQLAAVHGLQDSRQIVAVGSIKAEIQHTAVEMGADLIVVGNHARHGLKALVNFTEDAVLHTASCDVLAVHLPHAAAGIKT
ncbi:MAG: universal stress protein [Steroidobacteraceae bacterium]